MQSNDEPHFIRDEEKIAFYAGVQCIVRRGNAVLLGLRREAAGAGQWSLPGGHVEFLETPLEAASRELREETGLLGQPQMVLATFVTYTTDVPYVHVPVVFGATSGEPQVPQGEKFGKLVFVELDQLPKELFSPSRTALENYAVATRTGFIPHQPSAPDFLRLDFLSIRPGENRNRGYSIALIKSPRGYELWRSWGRRDQGGWRQQTQRFGPSADIVAEFRGAIAVRLEHNYVLANVVGDTSIQWLASLFPVGEQINITQGSLLRRLAADSQFGRAYLVGIPEQLDLLPKAEATSDERGEGGQERQLEINE